MPPETILEILLSKPHVKHYLDRYFKFILKCRHTNLNIATSTYMETHHICPKAHDMFPEYKDLRMHSWNAIALTARQHIIAHVLLWKAYPEISSPGITVYYMLHVQNTSTYNKNQRTVPNSIDIRYAAKSKESFMIWRAGRGCYKDSVGNMFFILPSDPLIDELQLVGHMQGTTRTDEIRKKMSASKDPNRRITLYKGVDSKRVRKHSDLAKSLISEGWHAKRTAEEYGMIESKRYANSSASLKHRSDYALPDGTFFGKLYADDPDIISLNLITFNLSKKRAAAISNQPLCVAANIGTMWYNNGSINKKFKSAPGYPWVAGVLYSDAESVKHSRAKGLRENRVGYVCYTDGAKNFYVGPGEPVDPSWVLGMKPQAKSVKRSTRQIGVTVYNDGIKTYRVYPGHTPDPSWLLGMAPRKSRDISA